MGVRTNPWGPLLFLPFLLPSPLIPVFSVPSPTLFSPTLPLPLPLSQSPDKQVTCYYCKPRYRAWNASLFSWCLVSAGLFQPNVIWASDKFVHVILFCCHITYSNVLFTFMLTLYKRVYNIIEIGLKRFSRLQYNDIVL